MKSLNWDHLFAGLVFSLVFVVIVLGGSSYAPSQHELVMRLWSVPVLSWSLFRLANKGIDLRSGFVIIVFFVIAVLISGQLVTVPIDVWKSLPGRAVWEADLNALGITQVSRPISLDPDGTVEALFKLLPLAAIGLAALCLTGTQRIVVLLLFLGLGAFSLVLGGFQLSSNLPTVFDYQSSGRSGPRETFGFFSNRNHWALFLVSLIPIAGSILAASNRHLGWPELLLIGVGFFAILVGVGASGSRAGMVLLAVGILLTGLVWLFQRRGKRISIKYVLISAGSGIALLAIVFMANGLRALDRFSADFEADGRWRIWEVSMRAAEKYLPLGSGGGSYVNVVKAEETVSELSRGYANQAHNEYIQILLEHGLPGILVLVFCVLGLVACLFSWSAARDKTDELADVRYAQVSYLVVFLVLCGLHSIVEFSLRTPTIGLMFAFCFVVVATPHLCFAAPTKTSSRRRSAK
jgi:O-antigen ligase